MRSNTELGAPADSSLAESVMIINSLSLDGWFWTSFCLAPFISLAVAAIARQRTLKGYNGIRSTMFVVAAFVVTFILTIASVRIPMLFLVRTDQALIGARTTFEQLPQINGIEVAATQDYALYSDIGGCCCSYGRFYVAYGTSLPARENFEQYIQELLASGWVLDGTQYETVRVLVRDTHELIVVGYGTSAESVWEWGEHPGYLAAQNKFPTLITARIDYLLPSRKECGH